MFKKIKTILKKKPPGGKEGDKKTVSGDSSALKSGETASSEKGFVQKKPVEKTDRKSTKPVDSKTVESKTSSPAPALKDKGRPPAPSKEPVSAKSLGAVPDSPAKAKSPHSVSDPTAGPEKPVVESKPVTPSSKSEGEADAPLKPKSSLPSASAPSATQEKPAPSKKAKPEGKPSTAPSTAPPTAPPTAKGPKPEKPAVKPSVAKSRKDVAVQPEAQTESKPESPSPAPETESEVKPSPEEAQTESKTESSSTAPETESEVKPPPPEVSQRKKEETPQRETVKLQGLFAFKQSMTSFYDEKGFRVPVTALKYEPWVVSQIKTEEKEGYSAVQLAGLPQKNGRCNRPRIRHLAPAGFREGARFIREIRQELPEGIKVGQELSIESLKKGDRVQISGRSKGRGFSGTVKRWGFHGGPASHGSKTHRKTGSIGQCAEPARVMPGRKMPGRYGFQKVTLNSVLVVDVLPAEGMIFIKGSVSGARNTLISLKKTGGDHA